MNRKDTIICIVAFIAIVLILWYVFRSVPVPQNNEGLQEYLQQQNDSLRQIINRNNQSIELSTKKTDSLIEYIKNSDWKIVKTKEYYETIIHDLDGATDSALQRFFNDRYDTKK